MTQPSHSSPRDEKIGREAADLWRELYGETPPATDGASMLDQIFTRLPAVDYNRLTSPHLRPSAIAYPRRQA